MMASSEAGPFNIGNPQEFKLADIAQKIIKMTESSSDIHYADSLLFMSKLGMPDISIAKRKIEWFPVVTLDKGLESVVEYSKAHKVMVNWDQMKDVND